VDEQGNPQNIRVVRGLGHGLDAKAVAAVKQWRFKPSMKDGHPVNVQISVEVGFRLY
jgi:TonB family protein